MKKKLLGMILALVVIMVIPLAVFAEEVPAPTLVVSDGLTAQETGDTVNVRIAVEGSA